MKMNVFAMVLCFTCFMLTNTASAQIIKPGPVSGKPNTEQPAKKSTKQNPSSPQLEETPLSQEALQAFYEIFNRYDTNDPDLFIEMMSDFRDWNKDFGPDMGGGSGGGNIGDPGAGLTCNGLGDQIENSIADGEAALKALLDCIDAVGGLPERLPAFQDCEDDHSRSVLGISGKLNKQLDLACSSINAGKCSLLDISSNSKVQNAIEKHCGL